jgi:hypothetical protein
MQQADHNSLSKIHHSLLNTHMSENYLIPGNNQKNPSAKAKPLHGSAS